MIELSSLTKSFRIYQKQAGLMGSLKSLFQREFQTNYAVKDFSMSLQEGEIIGLLGPNGAGKTTIMKMLTGIIEPSSGSASVLGHIPFNRNIEFRKNIALVMGQKSQLWWDIPALDSLRLLKEYYEISESDFQIRLSELTNLLGIDRQLQVHVRKLSLGERMKLELMASLLHRPKVLFLDEPTIGLDVTAQENIRQFLLDYHRNHKPTIILTSHYMADVEALCERIVLIIGGEKRFDGSILDFSRLLGHEKFVQFVFDSPVDPNHEVFSKLNTQFYESNKKLELRVNEEQFAITCSTILQTFKVLDFHSERLPIERVLKELLAQSAVQASGEAR